ncbi:MAG: hypothetical protein QHI48_03580 [Bacteroidota bacterium]|nr:hypothetical protein [Bacteroidota bacterium]
MRYRRRNGRKAAFAFALFASMAAALPRAAAQDTTFIDLAEKAAFRPGDDETWRSKYIDESDGWHFIPVPGAWERFGFPLLDGFAWYRIRFRIPTSLREDSLLLVMSAVDDADEAYLNGVLIGETGAFPPAVRREPYSLRVYPIPRSTREEYNLLAVRVYDHGDSGGITGSIFRIIRARDLPSVLDALVDQPFRPPPLFISNGVTVSAVDPVLRTILWMKPHLFHELTEDLRTETILSEFTVILSVKGERVTLSELEADTVEYVRRTAIVKAQFRGGIEIYWYHPRVARTRILCVHVRIPRTTDAGEPGFTTVFDRNFWAIREINDDNTLEIKRTFVLAWNSCCEEFAERDVKRFLELTPEAGYPVYSVEAETRRWETLFAQALYPPAVLSEEERAVYEQSLVTILSAKVREIGMGEGQVVDAFIPDSRAHAQPRDMLSCVSALAQAGMEEEALQTFSFILRAPSGAYTAHDVYGDEYGVGYPYLVTPAWYRGDGTEKRWKRPDKAELSFDGPAHLITTLDVLRSAVKRRAGLEGRPFDDSTFLASFWPLISARAADVLLFMRDDSGLIPHDDSPWGKGLSRTPGIFASLHAAVALGTAGRWADIMHDDTRAFLYSRAADHTAQTFRALVRSAIRRETATDLTPLETLVFHPLIIDAIPLDLFPAGSEEAAFVFDIVETAFSIEGNGELYNARPDGDWFERQARPLIALHLARAYASAGNIQRAEQLFRTVTRIALKGGGFLPELVDPVTGNWYGALPSVGEGAAEYITTAEYIAGVRARLRDEGQLPIPKQGFPSPR